MLTQRELCAFMRTHPGAFDVIVSADTLVYFGATQVDIKPVVLRRERGEDVHGHLVAALVREPQ